MMRYRLLGASGLRISQLCLGTMQFGQPPAAGGLDSSTASQVFNAFADAGGTFIDTADMYSSGESERILADLISSDRDHFVLATKFTQVVGNPSVTRTGNSRKAMMRAVEASLKRLNTDYIDLLYLHIWDGTTSLDEVMRGFEDLIRAGKLLYCGMSNVPAWVVARGQTLAELRGWSPLAAIQVQYNLAARTVERDLTPMANSLGIAVTAWGALGGGLLTGKYPQGAERSSRGNPIPAHYLDYGLKVAEIAARYGASPAQVALAWLLERRVIPVIGASTSRQVADNIGAFDLRLDVDATAELDALAAPTLDYPHQLLASSFMNDRVFAGRQADLC